MEKIIILTQPILCTKDKIEVLIKNSIKFFKNFLLQGPKNLYKTNDGPSSVVKSLVNGLKGLNIPFIYNPKSLKIGYDTVIVLSNVDALIQAIELKKKNRIKKLIAGPNIATFSTDYNSIISSPEIDLYLTPSDWPYKIFIEETPSLKSKLKIWFAGVDETYWKPSTQNKNNNVLVYQKDCTDEFFFQIKKLLTENLFKITEVKYGEYTDIEFKSALDQVQLSIFLSTGESQGIALAESWSMNVPTLVWNPQEKYIQSRFVKGISSAPYLTDSTGLFWKTVEDLKTILNNINKYQFEPRNWILNNMTDTISAQLFLNIIKENESAA